MRCCRYVVQEDVAQNGDGVEEDHNTVTIPTDTDETDEEIIDAPEGTKFCPSPVLFCHEKILSIEKCSFIQG